MSSFHQIDDPAAEEQAALWAARLEGSSLAAADHAALEAWLAENPGHRTLLSQYRQFSADLEEQLPALVAAGAVAMPARPASSFAKAAAGRQDGSVTSSRRGWSPKWLAGAALAAAALVMLAVWLAKPGRQSENFATAAAQRQSVTLIDGTRVELNAHTRLQVEIGHAERHVRLSAGEAFFTVSKDKAWPFIVETPAGSVRVTGTIFNVHVETASELKVTVVEGSVQVRIGETGGARASDPVLLHANDCLSAGSGGIISRQTLTARALDDVLAWRQGMIVFDNVPLREALARFAYYHERAIASSPGAENLVVGGRYSLDDLDGFFAALKLTDPVRVTSEPGGKVRVSLLTEP